MTVTSVRKDTDALTMTLIAEFEAPPERVWDLWADPRKLEALVGSPDLPRDLHRPRPAPGSHVEYHMTGPTGDQPHGFWDIVEADPPRRLVFLDGFANEDGTPNDDFPRNEGRVTIEPIGAGGPGCGREPLPEHRGHGAGARAGHGRGPHAGRRPDRRHPRRGQHHDRRPPMTAIAEQTTTTLAAPGAVLTYDIRGADSDTTSPVLLVIGSPMGASGFGTLSGHFPDRAIVTYAPAASSAARRTIPRARRRPSSTPTTSTGSSPSSAATPSTSSPAAAGR